MDIHHQSPTVAPGPRRSHADQERRYGRFDPPRLTVLRGVAKRPHRYRAYRLATMLASIVLLLLVPLLGVARFDLFGGEHLMLGARANALYGLIAVSVAIFSFYFFTFLVNLVAGRMFCGWGCPVGQLNRLTDSARAAKTWQQRALWTGALVLFAAVLTFSVELWWTSPAAFGAWPAAAIALAALAAVVAGILAFARTIGWSFCRKACPIGLYYSVVQQKRPLGILFDEAKCLDETACVKACPVLLDPRDMGEVMTGIGGLAIEGLAANNHCLRCGACVEACELATSKAGAPALYFGRPAEERAGAEEALVSLPSRPAPAELPAQALDPEEPALPWREHLLSGGAHGTFGSGLAPISLAGALLVVGAVFLFFGGALWAIPTGTSMIPRLLAATVAAPLAAVLALLAHRRLSIPRAIGATALVSSAASVLVTLLFVAVSPGSASKYKPKDTWSQGQAPGPAPAAASEHYARAPGPFPSGTISGSVLEPEAGGARALVSLSRPRPGLPLGEPAAISIPFGTRGLTPAIVAAKVGDHLVLESKSATLHTFSLTQGGRSLRNVPVPPHQAGRSVPAPPVGVYEIKCSNHAGEVATLVVFDHPYFTGTDGQGAFKLEDVPAGGATLVVLSGGSHHQRVELELHVQENIVTTQAISLGR